MTVVISVYGNIASNDYQRSVRVNMILTLCSVFRKYSYISVCSIQPIPQRFCGRCPYPVGSEIEKAVPTEKAGHRGTLLSTRLGTRPRVETRRIIPSNSDPTPLNSVSMFQIIINQATYNKKSTRTLNKVFLNK